MVNASLNWASIVGIVLAVGGAFLYFMRNFKPALARDYDVFFAAVGLLCGGILFFQGWRLDPILQFGQFLLAGTTVFFAYESVRLRGVTTEQARRSSFFEDEEPAPFRPRGGLGGGRDLDQDADRFAEPEPIRRRIPTRDDDGGEDFYRPRRPSRAAIPERAASRRGGEIDDWDRPRREPTGGRPERGGEARDVEPGDRPRTDAPSRYGTSPSRTGDFGARRRDRDVGSESRRGSRPVASTESMPRSSRRPGEAGERPSGRSFGSEPLPNGVPQGSPLASSGRPAAGVSDADFSPLDGQPSRSRPQVPTSGTSGPSGRPSGPALDNTSRFDD
ncbi:MAG: Ycf66 family protein [Synechococcaceae cyanobacterium ELA739]